MRYLISLPALALIGLVLGCAEKTATPPAADAGAKATTKADHHDHDHPTRGPHDGDLIELGDEEYHAEFVHDEKTFDITIYILDASAKNAVAIEAAEVVINLKHHGDPEQYKLAAEPLEGEGAKSSRFVSKQNEDLCHAIEEEDADARLSVTINGTPYSGKLNHDHEGHDHDDHDHEHEEHHDKK